MAAVTNTFTNVATAKMRPDPPVAGRSTVSFTGMATNAYAALDVIGGHIEFPSVARRAGGSGRITDITVSVTDGYAVGDTVSLVLMSSAPASTQTDNAALALADADAAKVIGLVQFAAADGKVLVTGADVVWSKALDQGISYVCDSGSQSIFGVLIQTGGTPTPAATTDVVQVSLGLEID